MKISSLSRLGGILTLISWGAPLALAAHHEDEEKHHVKVIVADERRSEPRTFLGVETSRISSTLTQQLGLDRGIGLVIGRVVPHTAAATALKKHDILLKFDDQVLVNSDQLGVLVRSKEVGAKVTLTLVRAGKQQTVTIELGGRNAGVSSQHMPSLGDGETETLHGNVDVKVLRNRVEIDGDQMSREEVELLLSKLGDAKAIDQKRTWITKESSPVVRMLNITEGNVVFSDEDGRVELISEDGKKLLLVKSKEGEVLFDGPISSVEDRAKLTDEMRQRLDKVESIEEIEFRTDSSFEVEDAKIVKPQGRSARVIRPKTERHVLVRLADQKL